MSKRLRKTFKEVFSLEWDRASDDDIHSAMVAGAKLKGTNMCILILAILIASIGLNMNSTAVIIGAMLISPLMGGIMAIGYGIATNDLTMAKNASMRLALQVLICIITSTIYFSLSPISTAKSELLARTNPTIWDVLIAICGGLAGIIGTTRKEKSNVIPGVAIATALMPPLCTAGFGLATHQFKFFAGALYLFFINGFFIALNTIIVIKLLKLPCKRIIDGRARRRLHRNITIIAIITIIPSLYLAYQIARDASMENNVNKFLNNEFVFSDTKVVQHSYNKDNKQIEVALIGSPIDENTIENLKSKLNEYNLSGTNLKITQTQMEITSEELQKLIKENGNKNIKENSEVDTLIKEEELKDLQSKLKECENKLSQYDKADIDISQLTKEVSSMYPDVTKCSVGTQKSYDLSNNLENQQILVTVSVNKYLDDEDYERMVNFLKTRLQNENISVLQLKNY